MESIAQTGTGMLPDGETYQGRYTTLQSTREPAYLRALQVSALTIPEMTPPWGHTTATLYPKPYQTMGMRGLNTIVAKAMNTLFPPNESFAEYRIDEASMAVLDKGDPELKKALTEGLAKRERTIVERFEMMGARPKVEESMRHAFNNGTGLLFFGKDVVKHWGIHQFVLNKDDSGTMLEAIAKDRVSPRTLSKAVIAKLGLTGAGKDEQLDMFSGCYLDGDEYIVFQEINGIAIDEVKRIPKDLCPFIPVQPLETNNDSYGRSYVGQAYGVLLVLEKLYKAVQQLTGISAKVIFMNGPGSGVTTTQLAGAPNGAYLNGDGTKINTVKTEKNSDLHAALELIKIIEGHLSYFFMLNEAAQRNGERVTAFEVQTMVADIQMVIGGIYALFTRTLQLRIARIIDAQLVREGKLEPLDEFKEDVKLTIVTGLAALGRGQDTQRLQTALQIIGQMPLPLAQQIAQAINASELLSRLFVSLGIDPDALVIPPQVVAQIQQQQQQQEAANQAATAAAPHLAKAHADAAAAQQQFNQGQ